MDWKWVLGISITVLGLAFTILQIPAPPYIAAKLCFAASAFALIVAAIGWSITSERGQIYRLVLVALAAAVAAIIALKGWDWVSRRQLPNLVLQSTPIVTSPKAPMTPPSSATSVPQTTSHRSSRYSKVERLAHKPPIVPVQEASGVPLPIKKCATIENSIISGSTVNQQGCEGN